MHLIVDCWHNYDNTVKIKYLPEKEVCNLDGNFLNYNKYSDNGIKYALMRTRNFQELPSR